MRPDPATRWPDGCEVVALTARLWSLRIRGPLGPMLTRLASLPVEDLQISEPHLEDVLRRYYADEPGAPERAN